MLDKSAIDAIQQAEATRAAHEAIQSSSHSHNVVALPNSFATHDMEQYLPLRRRARGVMNTNAVDSFLIYASTHAEEGAAIFVNQENMSASAVLNLGTPIAPGHADNRAALQLKKTAAFNALLNHTNNGIQLKQTQVAEFLEDWADNVACYKDGEAVATKLAIAAIRKITIDAMRKVESSEQQLSASRSAFESVQATSSDPLPTSILFGCQPYADLGSRTFSLRLSILTGNDKPAITLRIANLETHQEDMALELSDLIASKLESKGTLAMPVHLGEYKKV
jgi:uncharacterized protein YfdQ (DUF2303 family)